MNILKKLYHKYRRKSLKFYSPFSVSPLTSLGCLLLIYRERNHLVPVKYCYIKKDGRVSTYNISDSDYYVVFYESWLIDLYRAENLEKAECCYSLGGVSLKSNYEYPLNILIGGLIQRWYLKHNPMVSPSE